MGRSFAGAGGKLFFEKYGEIIEKAARDNKLEASLIRAVIHAESAFNARAVSPKGARGLMQLMPEIARHLGVANSFDPIQNIRGGSRHLALLLRRYDGNLNLTLAAYNAGESAVEQYKGIPPYTETREYVRKVLALKSRYSVRRS
jgi:soluble lytic murein transglycosylase-like protein